MKLLLLPLLLCITLTIKIRSPSHDQLIPGAPSMIVGAYSSQDINNLPDDFKEIDTFLRAKFPQLQSYKLTKAESQVVEGINFRLTYSDDTGNKSVTYTVWDRPWLNLREVSEAKSVVSSVNSNGEKVITTKTIAPDQGQFNDAVKSFFK